MKKYCDECGEFKKVTYCEVRDKYTDNFAWNGYYCNNCIEYINEESDYIAIDAE